MTATFKILICDLIGLRFDADRRPDHSEVMAHIEARGGYFHEGPLDLAASLPPGLHFFYQPDLSRREELLNETADGRYDGLIAAATFIPAEARFALGGVRIGAGTGNMGSASWGGGSGMGGEAVLMNTPGFNSRATAQMAMKAVLRVLPDLPVERLEALVEAGDFDTGKDLRLFPTEKLEGKRFAVIGYGNIGREVAKLARAFGMQVIIHARERHHASIESEGFSYAASIAEAAAGADVLSVHIGLGPLDAAGRYTNQELIGEAVFSALADGAVLVNYDRGELVDTAALDRALASGRLSHAAIDADLFKDAETGALSGPMLPYLPLATRHPGKLSLLPHAAADTDHPSRVAGAKQAVDQIFDLALNKRVTNLKSSLPDGYVDAGTVSPPGIGAITARGLAAFLGEEGAALRNLTRRTTELLTAFETARGEGRLEEALAAQGGDFVDFANRTIALLAKLGLPGPYRGD